MRLVHRKYEVTVSLDPDTANRVRECWRDEKGRLDRFKAPAYEVFSTVTGNKLEERYYQLDELHRSLKEGPAVRQWDEQGNLVMEAYYEGGRKINPQTGRTLKEKWPGLPSPNPF